MLKRTRRPERKLGHTKLGTHSLMGGTKKDTPKEEKSKALARYALPLCVLRVAGSRFCTGLSVAKAITGSDCHVHHITAEQSHPGPCVPAAQHPVDKCTRVPC